jgi:hypothetical protein
MRLQTKSKRRFLIENKQGCKYHSKNDNLIQAIPFTQCFVFGEFSPILQNILKKYILSQILFF